MEDKNAKMIKKRTEEAGKNYLFDEDHNPRLPADYWFQETPEGHLLFIVFYSQACRWAKCLACNLPSEMSQEHVDYEDIFHQVDYIFHNVLSKKQKAVLGKIIISNNGSIFDEVTFSTSALFYFVSRMNQHCPKVTTLTIETRPEYVEIAELELLTRALKEGETVTELEVAIGFEAFDDTIRNDHFFKGLSLEKFERFAADVAKYKHKLKTYFMLKPIPTLSEEDALKDILNGIVYLDSIAKKYKLAINLHLNPTYVAKGTPLEKTFHEGTFTPPLCSSVRKAILATEKTDLSIYVGLNDEGLAVEGGSFIREEDKELIEKFYIFNKTQDYSLLK